MNIKKKFIIDSVDAPVSTSIFISNDETLKLEIMSNATFKLQVYGTISNMEFYQISGIKDLGMQLITDITSEGGYTFDVSGYTRIRIDLVEINGGELSAYISTSKIG